MPLETGSFISDLQSANPDGLDSKVDGDNHIRLVKAVLKTTFPAINAVVTGTPAELNTLHGADTSGFFAALAAKATGPVLLTYLGLTPFGGRLDVVSTTQLVYQKFTGQFVTVISAGVQKVMQIPTGGVVTGLTNAGRVADTFEHIYLYDNAGVLTGEFSATAPVYNTTLGNLVKSGDSSRLFIGVSLTDAGAATWTLANGRVATRSWHNSVYREYMQFCAGTQPSTSFAAFSELNDNSGGYQSRIYFPGMPAISGIAYNDGVTLKGHVSYFVTSGASITTYLGINLNLGASVYSIAAGQGSLNGYVALSGAIAPLFNVSTGKNYSALVGGVNAGSVLPAAGYIANILGLNV